MEDYTVIVFVCKSLEFLVVNPILSDLAILCRLGCETYPSGNRIRAPK